MRCERCSKEITEGKFVQVPANKMTNQCIVPVLMHVVCCVECETSITNRIVGAAKVIEGEIVNPTPCSHPECRSHISHPCEVCGTQWPEIKET